MGEGIRQAMEEYGIPREEIFVITKIYPSQFNDPEAAIDMALEKLDIGYIDMMLLHHPGTGDVEAYKTMEKYVEEGKIRSLGLSNWYIDELTDFLTQVTITPALVQNEIHPYYQERDVVPFIQEQGIVVQSWYPLGGRGQLKNINANLIEAPDIFIESRKNPLCNVPKMTTGNRPADGGHLIIEKEAYEDFIKKEPKAKRYIKKLVGSEEFINNKERYCLWLVNVSPKELRSMPLVMKRVEKCKKDRLNGAPDRQKLAETPTLFRETKNPETYVIVPKVSSERRRYVPMGFMDATTRDM